MSTGITAEQNPGDSGQERSLGPGVLGSERSLVLCVARQKPVYTLGLPFLHLSEAIPLYPISLIGGPKETDLSGDTSYNPGKR